MHLRSSSSRRQPVCAASALLVEPLERRTMLAEVGIVQNIGRGIMWSDDQRLGTLNGSLLIDSSAGHANGSLMLITPGGTKTELLKEGSTRAIGPVAATIGSNALFTIEKFTTGASAWELWKTNGTALGTIKLKDLGSGFSGPLVQEMFAAGTKFYFRTGDVGDTSYKLWVSDATSAGTIALKTFTSDTAVSPRTMIPNGNGLYFEGTDATGSQIWKTDGTVTGTKRVTNGSGFDVALDYGRAQVWQGGLLYTSTVSYELPDYPYTDYYSNALFFNSGTQLASKLYVDASKHALQDVSQIHVAGANAYFEAYIGTTQGLWTMSNPSSGWKLVTTGGYPYPISMGTLKDKLIYAKDGAVYAAVGTTSTKLASAKNAHSFTAAGSRGFYFDGNDLWTTDGTTLGTKKLKTFLGLVGDGAGSVDYAIQMNSTPAGAVYFEYNGDYWFSDGTAAGTHVVTRINGTDRGSQPQDITSFKGSIYFTADDGVHGSELWKVNSTGTGASMVVDLLPGFGGSGPRELTPAGDRMYFYATDGENLHLYVTDGTAAGTKKITTPPLLDYEPWITTLGTNAYFDAYDTTTDWGLWKTDGTAAGTKLVKDITPGDSISAPAQPVVFKNALYFAANGGGDDWELWKSDGTSAGTVRVADVHAGATGSMPENLTVSGSYLYFTADDGKNGIELWKTTGLAGGTTLVKNLNTRIDLPSTFFRTLTDVNGTLYFCGMNQYSGVSSLYKTNGTAAGTVLLKNLLVTQIANANGTVYFLGTDDGTTYNTSLYKTNGTASGTSLVNIVSGTTHRYGADEVVAVGGCAYFTTHNDDNWTELWRTTPDGAAMVNLTPTALINAAGLITLNDSVYFVGDNDRTGGELYRAAPPPAFIAGTVWNDLDADRVKDSTESVLANVRVWIDANNDGIWQASEKYVITTSTGKYKFDNLAAGNYVVRAQLLSGKKFTTPSFYSIAVRAGMPYTRNFGLKAV